MLRGGDSIKNQARISKREVKSFIDDLKCTITNESFNADTDFILIRKDKSDTDTVFSTTYTLIDLSFDYLDVLDVLCDLRVDEYSETVFDNNDSDPILLHVFGKEINNRLIYIKLKIRQAKSKCIICVSFHYAKNRMIFPYR